MCVLELRALVAVLAALEHLIEGLVLGKNWAGVLRGLVGPGKEAILARMLMVMITFIPFFAFWEASRLLGEGKLLALFSQRRAS